MLVECSGKYDNVIQVHQAGLPFQSREDSVHHSLKRSWRCAQAEWKRFKFVETVWGYECRIFTVALIHLNLPISALEIKGGEVFRTP